MKIMHLLTTDRFSGAENVVCQIISLFRSDNRFEMTYCSCDGTIRDILNEKDIKFIPILGEFSVKNVRQAIKEYKPDLIHAHDMRASYIAARVCGRIPLISHIHNNNFNSRGLSLKSIAYLKAGFKAKHIFWVSNSSFNGYIFHNLLKKKSEVLYNIIDIDSLNLRVELDKNNYDYDVIFLGRLTHQKNPYRFLNICKLLVMEKKDIKIALVGTGEMEIDVLKSSTQMELNRNISFLGFKENPTKILHDSKVMIMTSLWEGTPMCVLEAMALGVPVVSTPVDGIKDLIEDGKNGFLSEDDDILAKRTIECINNKEIHHYLSSNQKKKAYEWNNKDEYYERLLKSYGVANTYDGGD